MSRTSKLRVLVPQIIEAYNNGMVLSRLATLYECSTGTIRNILKENDVPLRPRGRKKKFVSAKKEGE